MKIFKRLILIVLIGTNVLYGSWGKGPYTGIIPYYVSDDQKIYFLLGLDKSQDNKLDLYCNFRAAGSTIEHAAEIGKKATNDFFWKTVDDLKNQLQSHLLKIITDPHYSFYLVDVTQQVNKHGGKQAVEKLFFKKPVIWVDAEEYQKQATLYKQWVSSTRYNKWYKFKKLDFSYFLFSHENQLTFEPYIKKIKAEYPQKRLYNALEILTEKLTELKKILESLK